MIVIGALISAIFSLLSSFIGHSQSLVAMLKAHVRQPKILDASIEALERLTAHDFAIQYLLDHQVCDVCVYV